MCKRAFTDTLFQFGYRNLRNTWHFIVPTVLALLIIRYIGGEVQMNEELRWIIATIIAAGVVFGVTFLFNLSRAPVYIKFEKEREPRLIVERETSVCNHKQGYSWRLKIKNTGIDVAENCRGQLVEFADEVPDPNFGWYRWPKNEFLSWANGDIATRIQSKQTMELEILYGGGYQHPLYLAYAKGEDFRQEYAPKSLRENVFELKKITPEYPDITLYQQPDSHSEF
jgi:hypothetical protein